MLLIRKVDYRDAQTIALLGRITFNETFGHLFSEKNDLEEYLEKTFSVAKIKSSLQKNKNLFWLALWNELPVGYAKLKLDSDSEFLRAGATCQLQKIYVLKDFLSKKIGHRLQETLLQAAMAKGYAQVWLSVLDGNERAIRFYEKNGFKKLGTHDFRIGQEQFVFYAMGKSLIDKISV